MDKERAERSCSPGFKGISIDDGKCAICKHVSEDGQSCEAFPDGIPSVIIQ